MRSNNCAIAVVLCSAGIGIGCLVIEAREIRSRRERLRGSDDSNPISVASDLRRIELRRQELKVDVAALERSSAPREERDREIAEAIERAIAATQDARTESRFSLELCDVVVEMLPFRLAGVTGGGKAAVGVFDSLDRRRTNPATAGQEIGSSGWQLVGIEFGRDGASVARIRCTSDGTAVAVPSGADVPDPRPVGLFSARDGAVRLRAGDQLERAGVRYRVAKIAVDSPAAEIDWDVGEGTPARHRSLTLAP